MTHLSISPSGPICGLNDVALSTYLDPAASSERINWEQSAKTDRVGFFNHHFPGYLNTPDDLNWNVMPYYGKVLREVSGSDSETSPSSSLWSDLSQKALGLLGLFKDNPAAQVITGAVAAAITFDLVRKMNKGSSVSRPSQKPVIYYGPRLRDLFAFLGNPFLFHSFSRF